MQRSQSLYRLLTPLLAATIYTGLSACGPAPTTGPAPSTSPQVQPSSPQASAPVTMGMLRLRLQADASLAGFDTAQDAGFALCLSRIAAVETRIGASDAGRKPVTFKELLAGVDLDARSFPVGPITGRSVFLDAAGSEIGFVSWQANLTGEGANLTITLSAAAETQAGAACPRLNARVSGGSLQASGGTAIASPSPTATPLVPAASPGPAASPVATSTPSTPANLQLVESSTNYLILKWDFGGEPVSYRLYLDGKPVAENHTTPDYYRFEGLSPATSYRLGVQAVTASGSGSEIASLSGATTSSGRTASGNFSGGGSGGGGGTSTPTELIYTFDGEFQVNSFSTGMQTDVDAGMDAAGNYVLVWTSNGADGAGSTVSGQYYDNSGARLGSEFVVNQYTTGDQGNAAIAMNAAGDYVVVWDGSGNGDDVGIYGRYYGRDDSIGSEFRVNTYTTGIQSEPDVALDADGNFVVSWTNSQPVDGSSSGIYAQRFDRDGQKVGTTEFRVNSFTTSFQNQSRLAMNEDGGFVAIWSSTSQDGDSTGIYGQRYDADGSRLDEEFRVNTTTSGTQNLPAVGMDADGDFVVAWIDSSNLLGSDDEVRAQRFSRSGSPAGEEFIVNSETADYQYDPDVKLDSEGNFSIVWSSGNQDGDGEGVFGQRYDRRGRTLGAEFQVNILNTGSQLTPALALNDDGVEVVAWHDLGGRDGDGRSIWHLRYQASEIEGEAVSFADVTPVFAARCSGCHGDQFASYPEARSLSETIRQRVFVDRDMPDVPSDEAEAITEAERQLIADWVDQGLQP